ncbi:MAG: hypothetical protein EP329_14495 [Deltaproteobacteria bacterium]|nr:MAG: hypothetical protein EP329_14495 [Deltaproteobacteria bacterium]
MSDKSGFCPTCGIPWPNFCPIDGKRLNGAWTCANAPKPVVRPAATAEPDDATIPDAAVRSSAPQRRQADASAMQDFVDSVAARAPKEGGRRGAADPRLAATLLHPQLTAEDIKQAQARAEERAAAAEPPPEAPKKRKRDGFSDTQWFMKGLSLEVADPETGEVVVDEHDYQVDESIPETERRKFTLRKKGEE